MKQEETRLPWINSLHAMRKTIQNKQSGFFPTDFIGQNHLYPEASYAERERSLKRIVTINRD